MHLSLILLLSCLAGTLPGRSLAFQRASSVVVPSFHATASSGRRPPTRLFEQQPPPEKPKGGGPLDFILNPYESKIPKEIEKEIYEAEGNTAAAAERSQRILKYAAAAFFGVLIAFFNVFLTELRSGPTPDGNPVDFASTSFAWVASNPVTSFLFLNKIGGLIGLVGGAGAGLLAEAEFDGRRLNAEKIYEELVRRQERKQGKKSKPATSTNNRKKKRRSGKETKRIEALSEVISVAPVAVDADDGPSPSPPKVEEPVSPPAKDEDGGLFGKLKGFYDKADNMAASQALLLNKELEDKGLLEKITDETGLKVIGKDAASKLKDAETNDDTKQQ